MSLKDTVRNSTKKIRAILASILILGGTLTAGAAENKDAGKIDQIEQQMEQLSKTVDETSENAAVDTHRFLAKNNALGSLEIDGKSVDNATIILPNDGPMIVTSVTGNADKMQDGKLETRYFDKDQEITFEEAQKRFPNYFAKPIESRNNGAAQFSFVGNDWSMGTVQGNTLKPVKAGQISTWDKITNSARNGAEQVGEFINLVVKGMSRNLTPDNKKATDAAIANIFKNGR